MIIGIKEKGKVTLAYSLVDEFPTVNIGDMFNEANVGVWKVNRNPRTIMGCAYPSAETDFYRYADKLFAGKIDCDVLHREVLPAMEELTKGKNYIGDGKGHYDNLLIAQDDRLYRITHEHLVFEIDDYVVGGGYGDDVAKAVLHETRGEQALDRIRKAFEFVAIERQSDCYPIAVMDTATRKLRLLHKNKSARRI